MNFTGRPLAILLALTWVALAVLALLAAAGIVGARGAAEQLVELLPSLAPSQTALTVIGAAFGLCVEVLLVTTGVLVGYIQADRIFHPSALRWVNVLVIAAVAATALAFVALFFIPGPPQLFLFVEACIPVGATITLVLFVMRSLLRRAIAMQIELDEVV
jgi:hypothetical protein